MDVALAIATPLLDQAKVPEVEEAVKTELSPAQIAAPLLDVIRGVAGFTTSATFTLNTVLVLPTESFKTELFN